MVDDEYKYIIHNKNEYDVSVAFRFITSTTIVKRKGYGMDSTCLLYTSDAADE